MAEFKTLFEKYGADYKTTMARFMGNEALYLKILDKLFQDPNLKKLGDALSRMDMTEAFEAAHTLKGVAGNLGLTPLYEAVCVMVEQLRSGQADDCEIIYRDIQMEFEKVEILWKNAGRGESL